MWLTPTPRMKRRPYQSLREMVARRAVKESRA
jgi:hypothetical protein